MKREKQGKGRKSRESSSKKSTTNKRTLIRPKLSLSQLGIIDNLYESIIHNALDAFFITDNTGSILEVNDAFCRMEGYSRDELLSMRIQDLDIEFINEPQKFDQRSQEVLHDFIISNGKINSASSENKHRCKDGRIIDVEVSLHYLGPDFGFYFHFNRDITKRKQAEEKLRESKEFVENMLASMKDGFSVIDERGVHIKVSDSLCQITGFTMAELIGTGPPHPYWPEEEYENIQATYEKTLKGEFSDFELIFKRKNGERFPVIVSPSWLKDKEGNVISYFATIKDITERKKLQDNLMLYQNHLEDIVKKRTSELTKTNKKLEKLYQKEKELRGEIEEGNKRRIDFIRTLVHEIKTPFTPMIGASDMLVNSLEDEKLVRIAKNINRGAHSLNNRINDLMDLVSGEAGLIKLEYRNIDPLDLLSEAVEDMRLEADRKEQLLTLDICSPLPKIYGDSDRLRQVILNLLNNALKFTPKGGEITVSAEAKDDNLVISVSDTGCGIAKEDQRLLLERRGLFRAGRVKSSGLGLGLPLSKLLVELHGGKIWVNSKKGIGSVFSFSMPIRASS